MSEKRTVKNKIFVLLLLLAVSAAAIKLDYTFSRAVTRGHAVFVSFFSYPHRALAGSWRSARDFGAGITARRRLAERIRRLEIELSLAREKLAELESYRIENARMRELLDFREKPGFEEIFSESIGAEVVGRNPLNWYRTVMLDRGLKDGVREGMVVVGVGGVAGRIAGAGNSASSAMLILDPESRVSAVVERTGEHGIIAGRGDGILIMKYLSDRSEVKQGDKVRTSGLGGLFPKGISIGEVSGVAERDYGLTLSAEVVPAVDFSRLENVLILGN